MTAAGAAASRGRVLATGVYASGREAEVARIARELRESRSWAVEQRWIALSHGAASPELEEVTAAARTPRPKFELLNELLAPALLAPFDFLLVLDDDVQLPDGFVDRYLELVARHDLALAQPARSHDGVVEHAFAEQMDGLDARLTRFVEPGPVFSVRRDAFGVLLPFDEKSPLGWGYEFVWPVAMEAAGLRMGIVDATPVRQRARRPAADQALPPEQRIVKAFLAARPHISRAEAFTLLEAYA